MPDRVGIERCERALTTAERRRLGRRMKSLKATRRAARYRVPLTTLAIFGMLCAMTLGASNAPRLVVFAFWSAIAAPVGALSWRSATREIDGLIRRLDDALGADRARVLRIRSSEVVELEEIEDEGLCFAFQVAADRIAFLSGQELYELRKFPNDDFSIVEITDHAARMFDSYVVMHGEVLVPVRVVDAKTKRTLAIPDDLELIEGRLSNLESVLRNLTPASA